MELNERQQHIMELIREKGKIGVVSLAKELNYSEMTIRRDLTKMEKEGLLKRSHGMALENDINSQPITTRSHAQDVEKRKLCKEAAQYLTDKMTVFLDSSSTCLYLVPYIAEHKEMTIFTNSVQVLLSAANFHIPCYLTGGKYYEKDCEKKKTEEKKNVRAGFIEIFTNLRRRNGACRFFARRACRAFGAYEKRRRAAAAYPRRV